MIRKNLSAVEKDEGTMPLVSVVIPVYNVCLYLPQCLESVIHQTYRNLEIVVIDDGSSDGSAGICDEFAKQDFRIRVFHTGNRGLASARNLGLMKSSGLYLSFLDGDDWYELNAIETLLKTAFQTESDIVTAYYSREYIGKKITPDVTHESVQIYYGRDILPAFATGFFSNVVWNKLYHTSCFEFIRFPEKHNYEDVAATWKLMKALKEKNGRISTVPQALFHFRMRKSSITHTRTFSNARDSWLAYLGKYAAFPDYQEMLLPECMHSIGKMWMSYWGFSREDKRRAQDILKEMRFFSKENRHKVLKGNYPVITKAVCLLSQSTAWPVMAMCFYGRGIRNIYKSAVYRMYK